MIYQFFIAEVAVLLLLAWAALYQRGRYLSVVVIGLLARLALMMVHEATNIFGGADIDDYERYFKAFRQALEWNTLFKYALQFHAASYTVMYPGWIFYFFGQEGYWVIRVINIVISLFTLYPITKLYELVLKKKLTWQIALLITLWPTWLRYSIELGRSAPGTFIIIYSLYILLCLINKFNLSNLVTTLGSILFSAVLRVYHLAYYVLIPMNYIREKAKNTRDKYLRVILYPVLIIALVLFILGGYAFYESFFAKGRISLSNVNQLMFFIELRADPGGSTYFYGVYPKTPFDYLWYIPLHAFYFLFSPMPWDVKKPFVLGSSIQAMIVFVLVWLALKRNFYQFRKNGTLKVLMLTFLLIACGFGAVTKNAGGAERWRLPMTLVVLSLTPTLARKDYWEEESKLLKPVHTEI